MPPMKIDPNPRMPYQYPMPKETLADLVVPHAIPNDERIWVPQGENVWFRPLCLNRSAGYWMNLLKVRKSGVLSRHRHPQAVHGLVLKGRWHYLEHDWVAEEGSYVFEPPGGDSHARRARRCRGDDHLLSGQRHHVLLRRLRRGARIRGRFHED
jgi:2,4'-dihydroxyacetophenone dioxygenase